MVLQSRERCVIKNEKFILKYARKENWNLTDGTDILVTI